MSQTPALRRWIGKASLAVLSSMALAAGALSVGTAAQAVAPAGNPYAPSYQHPYRHGAVPTREAHAQIQAFNAAHPNAINAIQPNSANNLVYRGGVDGIGVTIGAPKVYLIFWGSTWGTQSTDANGNMTFSGDAKAGAPKLQMMFKGLGTGGELWSGIATQYCEGVATGTQICGTAGTHVGYPTGGNLAGVWYDNSAVATTTNGHQIAVEGVAAASHFGNTTPASNRSAQYVILSPTGFHPDGFNTTGANWCAWHDWNGDTTLTGGAATSTVGDVAFTNFPYVMDMGTSCGQSFVNAGTAGTLDGYTMVEGHEYMETITDQNPAGGYTDSTGAENGDKCAWVAPTAQGGAANVAMGNGSYAEQGGWSNDSVSGTGRCEISHAIVTGGGAGSPTVTNPGAQSGTVGTAASLTLAATGGTAPYTWSATGLPAGKTISTAGVISGTPTTAGTYSVTVTATDAAAASGSATFSWTISPVSTPGCTATNSTPVAIPDLTTVESSITISGCTGNASATSTVAVNITHTYSGDLVVSLVAPDASVFVLQSRVGGATANIVKTFTVNVSTKVANGLWKLRVQDAAAGDVGTINTWTLGVGGGVVTNPTVTNPGTQTSTVGTAASLTLAATGGTAPYTWSATGLPAGLTISTTGVISGTPTTAGTSSVTVTATDTGARTGSAAFTWTVNPVATTCTGTNATPVAIPDLTTVESPITLAGCTGNASATSTVTVHITHTWSGDLVVSLVAPDGTVSVLQSRVGGSTPNINTTYTVNLSTKVRNGLWKLRVQDAAAGDVGTINSWTLTL